MNLEAFLAIGYGLYTICSHSGKRYNGQIMNAMVQITPDPPDVIVSISKKNLTGEFIKDSGVFTVSVLEQDTPMEFIGKYGFKSGKEIDKFDDTDYFIGETEAPVITENSVAYYEFELLRTIEHADYNLFIGRGVEADVLQEEQPLTYKYYREVMRGKAPATAPTHVVKNDKSESKSKNKETKMAKYECTVCGYIYDPEEGDPENGIEPGTSFEELPDDWVCPVCGVGKDEFEKVE